ncbi:MAG: hypothetical protein I3274_05165, partial [Candidatus Moeniiplasma glomeromycotorum]|nr:hypothetical protein [Candidatus Moeniiplasma glomeromycotorum]
MKTKSTCNRCGLYFDKNLLYKRKDGKEYCAGCRVKIEKSLPESKSISQKDIDRIIEALL